MVALQKSVPPRKNVDFASQNLTFNGVGHVNFAKQNFTWPEASVIRRVQALSGFIGRKEFVGGPPHLILKAPAQPEKWIRHGRDRDR